MLTQIEFRENMTKWILWCVTIASISIIVNGEPCEPFRIYGGLSQVDPFSSFIFNIVAKDLNFVISKSNSKGLILGLRIGKNNVELTQLQYANDTIRFFPKDTTSVLNYKRILYYYSLMTGLEINFQKSTLVSWNNSRNNHWFEEIAQILNCKTQSLPFTYLGVLIGGCPKTLKF